MCQFHSHHQLLLLCLQLQWMQVYRSSCMRDQHLLSFPWIRPLSVWTLPNYLLWLLLLWIIPPLESTPAHQLSLFYLLSRFLQVGHHQLSDFILLLTWCLLSFVSLFSPTFWETSFPFPLNSLRSRSPTIACSSTTLLLSFLVFIV